GAVTGRTGSPRSRRDCRLGLLLRRARRSPLLCSGPAARRSGALHGSAARRDEHGEEGAPGRVERREAGLPRPGEMLLGRGEPIVVTVRGEPLAPRPGEALADAPIHRLPPVGDADVVEVEEEAAR